MLSPHKSLAALQNGKHCSHSAGATSTSSHRPHPSVRWHAFNATDATVALSASDQYWIDQYLDLAFVIFLCVLVHSCERERSSRTPRLFFSQIYIKSRTHRRPPPSPRPFELTDTKRACILGACTNTLRIRTAADICRNSCCLWRSRQAGMAWQDRWIYCK